MGTHTPFLCKWIHSGSFYKMSSFTRRRSSRRSPTNLTRPSPKCPVTENKNSLSQAIFPVSLCIFCTTCIYQDAISTWIDTNCKLLIKLWDHWTPLHLQTLPHKCQPY